MNKTKNNLLPKSKFLFFTMLTIFILLTLILTQCSSTPIDEKTPEGKFQVAEQYFSAERYEEALNKYQDIKNKHPYSKLAIKAKLKIAEIHFIREAFVEAQNEYLLFKELYPQHSKIDFVTFRIGLCIFNQLPSTIDRDLSKAPLAIQYFDEVINKFPNSPYTEEAKEKKNKILNMLAEKEFYIANFYYKQKKYQSALGRLKKLLHKYPNIGYNKKVLKMMIDCYLKEYQKNKALKYFKKYEELFPNDPKINDFKRKLKNNGIL